ncbi:hypothetical protein GCM10009760_30410 [Kitasatospora kazusensis]|uniref:TerD domain-containing protein n=1 Tax=Kitasatospora kazusensis TaxID=407974 RepID=A0ABP5LE16_9ACTN
MGVALARGGNVSLGKQAPGVHAVRVGLGWQAGAAYDLDASALLCDGSGKVVSDRHFVFFNNPRSPDGTVRHGGKAADGVDQEQIEVDLAEVPAGVEKIVFAVAIYDAAQRGHSFARVGGARIRLADRADGTELVRYDLDAAGAGETAMVFGELYRHGGDWKFRAVGQGYASGLAGIAADFGVDVGQPAAPAPTPAQPAARPAAAAAPTTAPDYVPAPALAPAPAPAYAPAPTYVPAAAAAVPGVQPAPGSSHVTCFFDPAHGAAQASAIWSPQWGVPRQIETCLACAQRVQSSPPPFYQAPQAAGYPQPVQAGYPQAGYPQSGYPQQSGQPQQRRFGTGALIGAGAAGLVGGALLNEAFSDDSPEVVVNNYYEDDDSFF